MLRFARNDGTIKWGSNIPTRQNWFNGWRLFALLSLTLVALSIWIAGMRQFEVDGVRMVIRFTALTSMLFFCLFLIPLFAVFALRMIAMAPRAQSTARAG